MFPAVAFTPATAFAAGPPAAATAFKSAVFTPAGGSVTGFGITATFAPGLAVHRFAHLWRRKMSKTSKTYPAAALD